MRVFSGEARGPNNKVKAIVENAGADWYRVSFVSWGKRGTYDKYANEPSTEKAISLGGPLKHYYLNVPAIIKMQNHPPTAAVPSSNESGPIFLFQRSQGKVQKKLDKGWTWKLGALVPNPNDRKELEMHLEGPYLPRDIRFRTASHILCIDRG